jgi:DNA-binding protein H-NS
LENERRILQEKANKLQQLNRLRQEQRLTSSQENMQAAVNATQEMLMRQNLNDSAAPNQAPLTGMDAFLSTAQQVAAAQNELHNRQESADSGLGMGSNFNLGSIPEDMSMDTDLDTTLTAETNNGAGSAPNNFIIGQTQIGNVNNANTNGNIQAATNKMDANELISTVLPGHGEIGLGNDDIENMLNEEAPPIHWL